MAATAEGRLDIKVVAGRKIPRRNRIGRGDVIVSLTLGTSTKQTQVDKRGGSTPQWNDRITFQVAGLGKTQLQVTALEADGTIKHRKIGSCVVDLTRIFVEEEVDGWYTLTSSDKPMGDVYIEFTFTPKSGRKRLSKANDSEDEDFDMAVKPKAKIPVASGTASSAPGKLQRPGSAAVASSATHALSPTTAHVQLRPSMSDLRPYSSASMHDTELANRYAQKHGTKPLPAAPGLVPQAPGYDQTLLPGQAPFMHQRPVSYGGETLPVQYQPGMMHAQASPQQQPQLMALFAPPPGTAAQPPKILPDPPSAAPAYNPAYNPVYDAATYTPAYNPAYNPAYSEAVESQMFSPQPAANVVVSSGQPVGAMISQQPGQYVGYADGSVAGGQLAHAGAASYGAIPIQITAASPIPYQHPQTTIVFDPGIPAQSLPVSSHQQYAAEQPYMTNMA
ncbi:hypothetical protein LPJ61_002449, partial [Coemansia biformis]